MTLNRQGSFVLFKKCQWLVINIELSSILGNFRFKQRLLKTACLNIHSSAVNLGFSMSMKVKLIIRCCKQTKVFFLCLLQKKHKKRSKVVDEEPSLMKEDHEEIEGDNTPLQSPRDPAPPQVLANGEDQPGAEDKVLGRHLSGRLIGSGIKKLSDLVLFNVYDITENTSQLI